jgi:hypothetical protein
MTRLGSLKRSKVTVARPMAVNPTIRGPSSAKCSSHTCARGVKSRVIAPLLPLPPIALEACEREVRARGETTVFAGYDVVNLVGQGHIVLMQEAILAPLLGTLSDVPTQRGWNTPGRHAGLLRGCHGQTSTRFEQQEQVVDLFIDIELGLLRVAQAFFTIFVEQILKSRLSGRRKFKLHNLGGSRTTGEKVEHLVEHWMISGRNWDIQRRVGREELKCHRQQLGQLLVTLGESYGQFFWDVQCDRGHGFFLRHVKADGHPLNTAPLQVTSERMEASDNDWRRRSSRAASQAWEPSAAPGAVTGALLPPCGRRYGCRRPLS